MEYENNSNSDELTHWGVRGMKWGIRRYQNKDGSLTAAGKKRYNEELAKVREQEKVVKNRESVKGRLDRLKARQDAVAARKKALDDAESEGKKKWFGKSKKDGDGSNKGSSKKSVKDMTDEELANQIRRVQMEKQYESLTAQPEAVKKGNSFIKDFMEKAAVPAIQQAGQQLIKDKLLDVGKKKLGLSGEQVDNGLAYMKKKNEELDIVNKYYENKAKVEKIEAEQAAKQEAKQAEKAAAKEAKQAEKAAKKEAKAAEKAAKKEAASSSNSVVTKDTVSSGQSYVNNIVSSTVTTSPSNVSSGQSFVGRYDRAAIAGMDDD